MEVTIISYLVLGICFFAIKAYADIRSGGLFPIIFVQLGHRHDKFSSYLIGFIANVFMWPMFLGFIIMEECKVK